MQSDLEDALAKVTTLETKTSAIKEACVQLEKDRVFLETLDRQLTIEGETIEEELALWSDVRESSGEVDPTLAPKIDAIMDDVKTIFDWVERAPWEGTTEEVLAWQTEGMLLVGQYNMDYYAFETAYISAIQRHIIAVTELTES